MKHFRIVPDTRLHNNNVEQLAQQLCNHETILARFNRDTKRVEKQNFVSFETHLEQNNTQFVVTVPDSMETISKKALANTWNGATVETVGDPLETVDPCKTTTLKLKYHYCFALRVDRRTNGIVQNVLETLNVMETGDKIIIQTLCVPASEDWHRGAVEGYKDFQRGRMPTRVRLDKEGVAMTGAKAVGAVVFGTIGIVTELLTGEEPEKIDLNAGERALILRDGHLRRETLQKPRGDAFDATIRIAIQSKTEKQAKALERMVANAFRELDGDNQLIYTNTNRSRTWRQMKNRQKPIKTQGDFLSIPETARLFLMPSGALQEQYKINNIKSIETDMPNYLFDGGLLLGKHTRKGKTQPIYFPITNDDETCLPTAVIGGMGQGKTKGFGANRMVQAVRNGYGALFIDPAKHEVGNEIKKVLEPEQYKIINIKDLKPSFDWCETKYSEYGKGLMADAVLSFFEDMDDAPQTERYLRAFVIGMQTTRLREIFDIMENKSYLETVIDAMPEGIHKQTLIQYKNESDAMRLRLIKPIYNRMDSIMGDPFLNDCFQSDVSLDFVELLSEKKAIIIDVAKKDGLTPKQINLIGNLLMTKINLAMQFRPEEKQDPFFVIVDEPHQFNRSAKLWENMAVESRKWRVGFVWLFHYWEQLPKQARLAVKNALPHYHIYPTSKETFQVFADELAPFELSDCMKLKRFHAFNILRTHGESTTPFVAEMARPPSEQPKPKTKIEISIGTNKTVI